jgi:hypothetical protein
MRAMELTGLTPLMNITGGREEIRIGLVDGPVAVKHTDLAQAKVCPVAHADLAPERDAQSRGHHLRVHQPPDRRHRNVFRARGRDRRVPVPRHQAVALLRPLKPKAQKGEGR